MSNADFENQKNKNTEAFRLLYDIEIILRELCASKLEALHGHKWAKRGLPPDLLVKVSDALAYEQKSKWHRAIPHHPLYYIDFPDLKKIVLSGGNWSSIFSEIFGQKPGTDGSLSQLELLRNQVAHNRFVSDGDLKILRGIHSQLLQSIPRTDLDAARHAASDRIPIALRLQGLSRALKSSLEAMETGSPLHHENAPDLALIDAWWFDSAYLGQDIEAIRTYSSLSNAYCKIPSGVGQAIYRRKWIGEHDALTLAKKASTLMQTILVKASHSYE